LTFIAQQNQISSADKHGGIFALARQAGPLGGSSARVDTEERALFVVGEAEDQIAREYGGTHVQGHPVIAPDGFGGPLSVLRGGADRKNSVRKPGENHEVAEEQGSRHVLDARRGNR